MGSIIRKLTQEEVKERWDKLGEEIGKIILEHFKNEFTGLKEDSDEHSGIQ